MISLPLPVRRAAVVAGVALVLVLGAASIRAASVWTAAAAPLTVAPVTVSDLEAKLAQEQARSAALQADLVALDGQVAELRSALDVAKAQLGTDTATAGQLADRMQAAKTRLARLDALIASAQRQLSATLAAARASRAAPAAPATPAGGGEPGDD